MRWWHCSVVLAGRDTFEPLVAVIVSRRIWPDEMRLSRGRYAWPNVLALFPVALAGREAFESLDGVVSRRVGRMGGV